MSLHLTPLALSGELISSTPMIAELWRGEVLESQHVIHATLTDEAGRALASIGDPSLSTTARSALKPFQLWAGLSRGVGERFTFSSAQLALMCASHNGEPQHITACHELLSQLGEDSDALECGAHPPYHGPSAERLLRSGERFTAVHNNCSGKHCGLLALRAHLSADGSYLSPDHPTQQAIFDSVRLLLGVKRDLLFGVDGCSLPTPEVALKELALLFARLAAGRVSPEAPQDPHLEAIFDAMNGAPDLVAGTGRFDTALMRAFPQQLVSKVGGEAIRGLALKTPDGGRYGVALKVSDGAMRALHPACIEALKRWGLLSSCELPDELARFVSYPEENWNGLEVTRIKIR